MHESVSQLVIKISPTRGGTLFQFKSDAKINVTLLHHFLGAAELRPGQGHMWKAIKVCLALFKHGDVKSQGKNAGLSFMVKAQAYQHHHAKHVKNAIYERFLA